MSEDPARSEIDLTAGGGWGAPLKADFGPVDIRRPGLLFNGLLARTSARSGQTSLAGPPLGTFGRLVDGTSMRTAVAPAAPPKTPVRPRPVPAPAAPAAVRPATAAPRPADPPTALRVTQVDLRSVAKASAVFYGIVLIVMVVASVLLWVIADAAGAVHSIDHSVQSLFGVKQYALHPVTIAMYSCVAGLVVAVTGTLVNVLAATVYNLVSDVVGGIRVKVTDT